MKGLSSLVVGNDDDARGSGGPDEEREVKGAGGEGESRDTSAPRASAQVAAYTLECFRMLKVSEELADEGKNHAVFSLVEVRFSASQQLE